jgi:hypothetical protein
MGGIDGRFMQNCNKPRLPLMVVRPSVAAPSEMVATQTEYLDNAIEDGLATKLLDHRN